MNQYNICIEWYYSLQIKIIFESSITDSKVSKESMLWVIKKLYEPIGQQLDLQSVRYRTIGYLFMWIIVILEEKQLTKENIY